MITLNYTNLKAHITKFVGNNKKYDAVVKENYPEENTPSAPLRSSSATTERALAP